jgi:molybdopterin synthase sulfur carrier subunit
MEIKVYATLRDVVGGASVHLDSAPEMTVEQLLQELFARYPILPSKFFDAQGDLHRAVHILINGRDMRFIDGLDTVISSKDEVRIFPPVGGGA